MMDQTSFLTNTLICDKSVEIGLQRSSQNEPQCEVLLECTLCQENFINENDLTNHYREHMVKNLFMCISDDECEVDVDEQSLTMDMQQDDEYDIFTSMGQISCYQCVLCRKLFSSKRSLKRHCSTHAGFNLFNLDECDMPAAVDQTRLYECDVCHKIFLQHSSLVSHFCVHAEMNLINSDAESKINFKEQSFSVDMPQTMKCDVSPEIDLTNSHECDVCHKVFSHKYSLKRHYSVHGEINLIGSSVQENKYACPQCGKSFLLKEQLKKHQRCHVKPYECDVCLRMFAFKSALIAHRHTHMNKNSNACPICLKCFSSVQDLQIHYVTHNEIQSLRFFTPPNYSDGTLCMKTSWKKNYNCDSNSNTIFKDKISAKASLTSIRDNTNAHFDDIEELFNSNLPCHNDKKLSAHQSFKKEKKRHTCIVCYKSFSKISHLQCHHRIHTGEKPFSCSVCKRAFSEKGNLIKHEIRHQRDFLKKSTF